MSDMLPTTPAFTAHNALPEDVQEWLLQIHKATKHLAEYLVDMELGGKKQDEQILAAMSLANEFQHGHPWVYDEWGGGARVLTCDGQVVADFEHHPHAEAFMDLIALLTSRSKLEAVDDFEMVTFSAVKDPVNKAAVVKPGALSGDHSLMNAIAGMSKLELQSIGLRAKVGLLPLSREEFARQAAVVFGENWRDNPDFA